MNLRQIQELIKFVAKSGATEVDIEIGDVKLSIKSPPKGKVTNTNNETLPLYPNIVPVPQQPIVPQTTSQQVSKQQPTNSPPIIEKDKIDSPELNTQKQSETNLEDNKNYITIKAPIIGTFYRRSSPDKEPFVNVGDKIEEGRPLCIIEAMKLFNEIESELSGTIVKVLVEDMSPVEYDQPLFLIDPA